MVGLVVLGVLAFCVIVVVGTLVAAASLLGWLVSIPFHILGFVLRGIGVAIAIPFILLAAVIGVVVFGFGAIALFVPMVPFVILALGVAWLVRHNSRSVHSS